MRRLSTLNGDRRQAVAAMILAAVIAAAFGSGTGATAAPVVPTAKSAPPGTTAGQRGMAALNSNGKPYAYALVSAPHPVRYGKFAERFELRDADCNGADCEDKSGAGRSELNEGQQSTFAKLDNEYWYGWSMYIESLPTGKPSVFPNLGQWKLAWNHGPLMKLMYEELGTNAYDLMCMPVQCTAQKFPINGSTIWLQLDAVANEKDWTRGRICPLFSVAANQGRWVDLVLNIRWSRKDDGFVKMWVNDELRCDYKGATAAGPQNLPGPRHMRGIYWHNLVEYRRARGPVPTAVVYYDEFRGGRVREQVDIRMIEKTKGAPVD
jgi:hypothetical protein